MTTPAQVTNRNEWQSIITDWLASGLNQRQYCNERNLNTHKLSYYYRKYYLYSSTGGKLASVSISDANEKSAQPSGFVVSFPSGIILSVPTSFC